ncbi:MAG: PQQ-binding-like beta-propeller repeat protein, partial [Thermoleophilia bacterium]
AYQVRVFRPELQWPAYGATPGRTQVHPAIDLRPPFRLVWSRGLGSLVEFPAVVWEGVAYVTTLEGWLYALSMRDGAVLWKTRVGTRMASSPGLAPDRGELAVVTMSPGDMKVVDMKTGKVRWRLPTGLAEPSPVVIDDVAYFAATSGLVYAVDLEKRRPRWTVDVGAKVTSSPAVVDGTVYVGDYDGDVHALAAGTGKQVWEGSAGSRVYGTVAVSGGTVFAPSVFSGLSALNRKTGELRWRIPTADYLYSSPAAYRGRVFFGDYTGRVSAADAATGRILWTQSAGGSVSGAIQVVAGVVYAGSFAGRITGWDWRTGAQVFRFGHGQYVPVSGNGGRLLLHGYSRVYAVEPKRARAGAR